jgi:hypothetical protein
MLILFLSMGMAQKRLVHEYSTDGGGGHEWAAARNQVSPAHLPMLAGVLRNQARAIKLDALTPASGPGGRGRTATSRTGTESWRGRVGAAMKWSPISRLRLYVAVMQILRS